MPVSIPVSFPVAASNSISILGSFSNANPGMNIESNLEINRQNSQPLSPTYQEDAILNVIKKGNNKLLILF